MRQNFHFGQSSTNTKVLMRPPGLIKGVYIIGKTDGKGYVKRSNPDFSNAQDVIRLEVMDNIVVAKRIDNPSAGWGMFLSALLPYSPCVPSPDFELLFSFIKYNLKTKYVKEDCLFDKPIPKVLYQTSPNPKTIPDHIHSQWDDDVKRGWVRKVYSNQSLTSKLFEIGGSAIVECFLLLFNGYKGCSPAHAIDFARYVILLAEGGVYLDIKILKHSSNPSIETILGGLPNGHLISCSSINPGTLFQGVLACPAGALTMWNILCSFLDEVISSEPSVEYLFATRSIFETVTKNNVSQDLQGVVLLREHNHHEIDLPRDRYNLRCSIYLGNRVVLRSRDPNYKNPRSKESWE